MVLIKNYKGRERERERRVAISTRLNGFKKTHVSLLRLVKYFLVSTSFVPFPWALFLPLDEVNAMMAIVVVHLLNIKQNVTKQFVEFAFVINAMWLMWLMP